MFIPESYGLSLLLMIVCMVCWGSWANTYKMTRNVRFELFYFDYAFGIFGTALLIAFTLGSWTGGPDSFIPNLAQATGPRIGLALLGGVVFNLANILLVAAIAIAGLAVAFPLAIGTALVLGTLLTYLVQRTGDPLLLFLGVGLAVLAIIADALAYRGLGGADAKPTRKGIWICIAAGLLMGIWSPFTAASMAEGTGQLGPYTSTVFFTMGAFVSTFFFNVYFMRKPLVGEPVSLKSYLEGDPSWHVLGLVGGFIWCIGTAFNLIAGRTAGFAVAYAIGQSAPMVAALWGLFVWKEFEGSPAKSKFYLALMFVFYAGAIAVIANAA